jgi:hypothetical protein
MTKIGEIIVLCYNKTIINFFFYMLILNKIKSKVILKIIVISLLVLQTILASQGVSALSFDQEMATNTEIDVSVDLKATTSVENIEKEPEILKIDDILNEEVANKKNDEKESEVLQKADDVLDKETNNIQASSSVELESKNNFNNLPKDCVDNNVLNEVACNDYLFVEATKGVICPSGSDDCLLETREKSLHDIAQKRLQVESVAKIAESIEGGITVGDLKNKIGDPAVAFSLRDDKSGVKILKSETTLVYQDNKIVQDGAFILVIDSDGDGLPDDLEKKIGTDVNNVDSDNDTFSDYAEYRNGYNPLGAGKLVSINELAPVEVALVNDEVFEQPRTKGSSSNDFLIESVKNLENIATSSDIGAYLLQGRATPNIVVTLYVYSDLPLLVTVRTDDYGNWKYELRQSLSDGEHEVYVVLNDATGKVVAKSNPLSFLIKDAQAATINGSIPDNKNASIDSETNNIFIYYLIISGFLILSAVLIFLYILKRKRNLNA